MLRLIAVFVVGLTGLSGCSDGSFPGGLSLREAPAQRGFLAGLLTPEATVKEADQSRALARVRLARGDVVVTSPDGYCIDPTSLGNSARSSFALIASCEILNESTAGRDVAPLVMTVTVGPRGTDTLPGAADLAQSVEAGLLASGQGDRHVLAHLATGGDARMAGGDPRHWRGAMQVNGHLVGLALYAPRGSDAADSGGGPILSDLIGRIATDSPQRAPLVQARVQAEQAQTTDRPLPRIGQDLRRVWARLTAP